MKPRGPERIAGVIPWSPDPHGDTLLVGKCIVEGFGLRVGLSYGAMAMHMTPVEARALAAQFETPSAYAVELDWVAGALREAADEIDAMPGKGRMQ
jgi:hypothetical protein